MSQGFPRAIARAAALFVGALVAAPFSPSPAYGAVELRLKGGTLLSAAEVERQGDSYQVSLPDGSLISIPVELVVGIGASQEKRSDEATTRDEDPGPESVSADSRVEKPATSDDSAVKLGSSPELRSRTLPPAAEGAGIDDPAIEPPVTTEEPADPLDATRGPEPAEPLEGMDRLREGSFKKSSADSEWTPESDWSEETDVSNFAPVEWKKPGIDPEWTPESDYSEESDVSNFAPAEWKKPSIDPTWRPTDAFGRTDTSLGVDPSSIGRNVENGIASWYGERFQGKTTASGALYEMNAFTAAHPSLPFGTLVNVTDRKTGRSVPVKITDRGPSIEGRVINLSFAAARQLGIVERGLADVVVETLPD